ncbi:predicted protein [Nematostella vectensis]|uniref:Cystatin domain-containing protein n=1 Tax=Nematostella vectensis TaxID=45351 RepID=A7RQY1_NEMVE|nr:predicted protein [Nematostella vectensis]|eukprot:XP_001638245.1 predicted protein [Nematostella vectensis]
MFYNTSTALTLFTWPKMSRKLLVILALVAFAYTLDLGVNIDVTQLQNYPSLLDGLDVATELEGLRRQTAKKLVFLIDTIQGVEKKTLDQTGTIYEVQTQLALSNCPNNGEYKFARIDICPVDPLTANEKLSCLFSIVYRPLLSSEEKLRVESSRCDPMNTQGMQQSTTADSKVDVDINYKDKKEKKKSKGKKRKNVKKNSKKKHITIIV